MTNNTVGRDKQARDAERRQNERETATERERGDEMEPPVDGEELVAFEAALDGLIFPATGAEVVPTVGNHRIESVEGSYRIEDLVPDTDEETFDSPGAVRVQVRRPTVAAVMQRIVETSEALPNTVFRSETTSGSGYRSTSTDGRRDDWRCPCASTTRKFAAALGGVNPPGAQPVV